MHCGKLWIDSRVLLLLTRMFAPEESFSFLLLLFAGNLGFFLPPIGMPSLASILCFRILGFGATILYACRNCLAANPLYRIRYYFLNLQSLWNFERARHVWACIKRREDVVIYNLPSYILILFHTIRVFLRCILIYFPLLKIMDTNNL